MTESDSYGQSVEVTWPLGPLPVSVSVVIVRRRSRESEWFCRKGHQSGNKYWFLQSD